MAQGPVVRFTISPQLNALLDRVAEEEPCSEGPFRSRFNCFRRADLLRAIVDDWLELRGYWVSGAATKPLGLHIAADLMEQLEAIASQVHESPAQTAEQMLQAHLAHCERSEIVSVKAGHLETAIRLEIEHLQALLEDLRVVVPVKPAPAELNN